jgi:hypothetical protein
MILRWLDNPVPPPVATHLTRITDLEH